MKPPARIAWLLMSGIIAVACAQDFAQAHTDLKARVFLTTGSLDDGQLRASENWMNCSDRETIAACSGVRKFLPVRPTPRSALSLECGIRWLYGDLAQKS